MVAPCKSSGAILKFLQLIADILMFFCELFYIIASSTCKLLCSPTEKSVRDDIVLITGAGHGIGRQLALEYAAEGAMIVCWDINEKNNLETIQKIAESGHRKAFAYVCDVTNRNEVQAVAKKVLEDLGPVTILVNNAGIMPCREFLDYTPEEIERTMQVNVMAHYWTIQAFLPKMKEINRGHVVALSSCVGLNGQKFLVPYCASKFAVRGLMEALYLELRSVPYNKIKTTTVYPYMANTGLCKAPKIRFQSFMGMLDASVVAKAIVKAQKRDIYEISVPSYILTLNYLARLLPVKAALLLQDFLESYVEPDSD